LSPARRRASLCGALLVCLVVIAAAPLFGGTAVRLREALRDPSGVDGQILLFARVPRVLAAALAGAGLAVAGAGLQAVLRNPLADPFTVGVSGGSAVGAALVIRLGLEALLPAGLALPAGAFLGALSAVLVAYGVARAGAALPPATLLLAGVTVSFVAGAAVLFLQHTADLGQALRIGRWLVGSLDGIPDGLLRVAGVLVFAGAMTLHLHARALNAVALGAEAAASVGVDVHRVTRRTYLCASVIVGALVAVAGPIGFVGLIVPHLVRSLVGADHRLLLPVCLLSGAAFLVACDVAARVVLAPAELPVGVVTAALGGPFFLVLLRRGRGGGLWA
jgi:ABC-type Fe3+-siderophore transport system permease subunit